MQILRWNTLSSLEQNECLKRPAMANNAAIAESVKNIIQSIQTTGDRALRQFTETFDQTKLEQIALSDADIDAACARLNDETRAAIDQAYTNISSFHQAQIPQPLAVETLSGVVCEMISRPINRVGLYIPGGTAPLPSTVLMLGVPSQIAGCKAVVLCSPPPIADEILYAAKKCGIESIYQIGGAQAVAAMAYGTETVTKVDKIFGPGNAFVTEAKRQVSADHQGAAIDMPAGPSEVLVIADAAAKPEFIAADLLSQAEHGADSQVMLVTPSSTLANHVQTALTHQLSQLSRAETAAKALSESRIIIAETIEQCVEISNQYAPEHLIVHTENPRDLLPDLDNAGSIFLGEWSPESVGDYASGTNHVLPTYGFTRTYSSLGLADFSKRMTVQTLSPSGLKALAPTVITLANAEGLDAHRNAVTIRLQSMDTQ